MGERVFPTRTGRWGVRQLYRGDPTGGGTVGCGWDTEADALEANRPQGDYSVEVFDRYAAPVAAPEDGEPR